MSKFEEYEMESQQLLTNGRCCRHTENSAGVRVAVSVTMYIELVCIRGASSMPFKRHTERKTREEIYKTPF